MLQSLPEDLYPMLCKSLTEDQFSLLHFTDPKWIAEMKYDGRRSCLILKEGEVPQLFSRPSGQDRDHDRWQSLSWCLGLQTDGRWPLPGVTILDVEIIDRSNAPRSSVVGSFLTSSTREKCLAAVGKYGRPRVVILDVLMFRDESFIDDSVPLKSRLDFREEALADLRSGLGFSEEDSSDPTVITPKIISTLPAFQDDLTTSRLLGREGYIFKKLTSAYSPGIRSKFWLKYKFGWSASVIVDAVEYDSITATSIKVDGLSTLKKTAGRVTRMLGTCTEIYDYNPGPARKLLDDGIPVQFWGANESIREELESLTGGQGQEGIVRLETPLRALVECNGIDKEGLRHPRFDRWED